ncbi:hypothetical protein [Oceanicella sp. SM1341]|uniref:hypothetical protein n=1 Tax=Oceanicella sp. SM1341 TaxID=1548889 RepID=UPI000E50AD61|nr:hypothetical protein [Oceanicella sp. SM1341]
MSAARALWGTDVLPATARRFTLGALSFTLEEGALRHIRHGGTELIRSVSFPVRDRDWGTLAPEITDLAAEEGPDRLVVTFHARFRTGTARLDVTLRIEAGLDRLTVSASGRATGAFETNRAGFTVLHPILGVAGAPVTVTHGDGREEAARFPLLIAPWQPFKDIRALRHVAGGLRVTCLLEGDTFEMEDQRQWGDASFKTYNRPLALPWPYRLEDGAPLAQSVHLSWAPAPASPPAEPLPPGPAEPRFPETALVITAAEATRAAADPTALRAIAPQRLLCHLDTAAGQGAAELAAFAALQRAWEGAFDLELIARCPPGGDLGAEFAGYAAAVAEAGFRPASVMVCPSVDRQSTPPGSAWPACPPLADIHRAARAAFPPGMAMGGGMASFFPELNRKPPPVALLDFATHGLCPIVHAADDVSVMEGLEAVPYITASARALLGGLPCRLGPSTIAMRQNPYGSRTMPNPGRARLCMADDDPRQDGAFAAAWTLGLATALAPAGLTAWTPAALYGPRGLIRDDGSLRPLADPITRLARLAGAPVHGGRIADGLARLELGDTLFLANLTPEAQEAEGETLGPYACRVTEGAEVR